MNTKMRGFTCATLMAGMLSSALAAEQEYGDVISKTALYDQVSVPERQCVNQQQSYRPPSSGAGAVLGAVAGGVVGNALGRGAGKAAATGLGVIAGAVVGDRVEANATPPAVATVQSCHTVMRNESHFVGYDVTYDYKGQRYTARLPNDPGDRVALNIGVSPVGAQPVTSTTSPALAPMTPAVVYSAPSVVYAAPPSVVYAPYPPVYWGPSVGVGPGWGWGRGYRHWR